MPYERQFVGVALAITILAVVALIAVCPQADASRTSLLINLSEDIYCRNYYNPMVSPYVLSEDIGGSGEIGFTNVLGSTVLQDINVTFNKGYTVNWTLAGEGDVSLYDNGDTVRVHITRLQPGATKVIRYDISPDAQRPMLFNISLYPERILVGQSTNVTFTVSRNFELDPDETIEGITFVIRPVDTNANGVNDWALSDPRTQNGTAFMQGGDIVWNARDLTPSFESQSMVYRSGENDRTAHSALGNYNYNMTITDIVCRMQTQGRSHSGVYVIGRPLASTADVEISLDKQTLKVNTSGMDWGFVPRVRNTNPEGVDYVLNAITLWITDNLNLNTTMETANYQVPYITLNSSMPWTGDMFSVLNFGGSGVPVGWLKISFYIDDDSQILRRYYSSGGSRYLLYVDTIVVNGYYVEVHKTVTRNSTDSLDINLHILNTGTVSTPDNVIVFDIVPASFDMTYLSVPYGGTTAVATPVNGYAYWWNLGMLTENDHAPGGTDERFIKYTVTGDVSRYGSYDAFLIGIDPTNTFNLQSSRDIESSSTINAMSIETIALLALILLLLISLIIYRRKN